MSSPKHLVLLGVSDMDTATKFYKMLGWRYSEVSTIHIAYLEVGDLMVVLTPLVKPETYLFNKTERPRAKNVFYVRTEAEQKALLKKAHNAGGQMDVDTEGCSTDRQHSNCFTDPDHNVWEVTIAA